MRSSVGCTSSLALFEISSSMAEAFERPIAQIQTKEFRHWFAQSKVLDSMGLPMVMYHGTDVDVSIFKPSLSGHYGTGIYFADYECAENHSYGDGCPNIIPVYLSLQNPYCCQADYEVGEEAGFDSAALPLIQSLFGKSGRRSTSLMRKAEKNNGNFGKEVEDEVRLRGHDGLILIYPDESQEIVVYSPWQIKSAIGNCGDFDPLNPRIDR